MTNIFSLTLLIFLSSCVVNAQVKMENKYRTTFFYVDTTYYISAVIPNSDSLSCTITDGVRESLKVHDATVKGLPASSFDLVNPDRSVFKEVFKYNFKKVRTTIKDEDLKSNELDNKLNDLYDSIMQFKTKYIGYNISRSFGMDIYHYSVALKDQQELLNVFANIRQLRDSAGTLKGLKSRLWKLNTSKVNNPFGIDTSGGATKISKTASSNLLKDDAAKKVLKVSIHNVGNQLRYMQKKAHAIDKDLVQLKDKYAVPQVSLTGNALTLITGTTDSTRISTTGIGVSMEVADLKQLDFQMTVSQTVDSIISSNPLDFGSSILVPGIRRFSLLTTYRNDDLFEYSSHSALRKLGSGLSINITPMKWKSLNAEDTISVNAIPISSEIFFTYNWLKLSNWNRSLGKDIKVSIDFGLTARTIMGDYYNLDAADRAKILGNPRRNYIGLVTGIQVQIDGLTAFFRTPILFGPSVNGLTGGQTIANIGLQADILNFSKNQ